MAWLAENWIVVVFVVSYLTLSVVPRPTGADSSGWKRVVWTLADRICFLSAGAMPGKLKLPLAATVVAAQAATQEEKGSAQ